MVLHLRSLLPRLTALTLLLGATGCSAWLGGSDVNKTVEAFAEDVRGNQWKAAAQQCSADLTWSYYTEHSGIYTLRGAAAVNGFFSSIQGIRNRDGFYIDITRVTISGATATVPCTVRIPICYNRMELRFGKIQVSVQLTLVKLNDVWKITSIRELAARQE